MTEDRPAGKDRDANTCPTPCPVPGPNHDQHRKWTLFWPALFVSTCAWLWLVFCPARCLVLGVLAAIYIGVIIVVLWRPPDGPSVCSYIRARRESADVPLKAPGWAKQVIEDVAPRRYKRLVAQIEATDNKALALFTLVSAASVLTYWLPAGGKDSIGAYVPGGRWLVLAPLLLAFIFAIIALLVHTASPKDPGTTVRGARPGAGFEKDALLADDYLWARVVLEWKLACTNAAYVSVAWALAAAVRLLLHPSALTPPPARLA